jgi:hypothetical protein
VRDVWAGWSSGRGSSGSNANVSEVVKYGAAMIVHTLGPRRVEVTRAGGCTRTEVESGGWREKEGDVWERVSEQEIMRRVQLQRRVGRLATTLNLWQTTVSFRHGAAARHILPLSSRTYPRLLSR